MTILIAGYTGLVGSGLYEYFRQKSKEVVGISSKELNLLDRHKTFDFIRDLSPSIVIDCAAIVGGIGANSSLPVDFLSKNLQMQCNLMDASHHSNVEKFVFLGSSCIYPRECPQPIKEEYLLTGLLEPTNAAYAIAKIAGIELIRSYRKQHGRKWISIMPTNMYGPRDNFNIELGHVLPVLIHKFFLAKQEGLGEVILWGSGRPLREFLHTADLASAIEIAIEKYDDELHLNVGPGVEVSIKELASLIAKIVGFQGKIIWDETKPDGTPRKIMDSSRIRKLGWTPAYSLEDGIRMTTQWFSENKERIRQ